MSAEAQERTPRNVLVTGGNRGIGLAIARAFAEAGDTVVVFGAGPIGCMHIRIARGVHQAGPVYLVDVNAERLRMSADAVHPEETIDGSQVDVALPM